MSSWDALKAELEAWRIAGKELAVWWRDDDVSADTAALQRLLSLAAAHRVPLALAAIPARLQPSLNTALARAPSSVFIFQHGYSHENHAPPTAKKMELCARPFGSSDITAAADDLMKGDAALTAALQGNLASRRLPVLVPPWNRMDPGLVALLPKLGFIGLSSFGPNPAAGSLPVTQINCHLDIFRWKPARRFLGEIELLRQLTDYLQQRRAAPHLAGGAYGLLTHHLVHDEESWLFLHRLLALLSQHDAVRFPMPPDLFSATDQQATVSPKDRGAAAVAGETG